MTTLGICTSSELGGDDPQALAALAMPRTGSNNVTALARAEIPA